MRKTICLIFISYELRPTTAVRKNINRVVIVLEITINVAQLDADMIYWKEIVGDF